MNSIYICTIYTRTRIKNTNKQHLCILYKRSRYSVKHLITFTQIASSVVTHLKYTAKQLTDTSNYKLRNCCVWPFSLFFFYFSLSFVFSDANQLKIQLIDTILWTMFLKTIFKRQTFHVKRFVLYWHRTLVGYITGWIHRSREQKQRLKFQFDTNIVQTQIVNAKTT